jgi:hypothetical protein
MANKAFNAREEPFFSCLGRQCCFLPCLSALWLLWETGVQPRIKYRTGEIQASSFCNFSPHHRPVRSPATLQRTKHRFGEGPQGVQGFPARVPVEMLHQLQVGLIDIQEGSTWQVYKGASIVKRNFLKRGMKGWWAWSREWRNPSNVILANGAWWGSSWGW